MSRKILICVEECVDIKLFKGERYLPLCKYDNPLYIDVKNINTGELILNCRITRFALISPHFDDELFVI